MQVHPIGVIHTPFKHAAGAPLTPRFAKGVRGTVEVYDAFADGLKDVEGFDRIWLVFWFHLAVVSKSVTPTYIDPMTPHGVFATRAPSRPNPIGLSCVKLVAINGHALDVEEVDILDGTPLLDIKPYTPQTDIFEVTRTGWMGAIMSEEGADHRVADDRFSEHKMPED